MPGLLTLRPGLGSASKTAKRATSKHAVSSTRTEKGREERSVVVQGGRVPASSAFARRGVYRAPTLNPVSPQKPLLPVVAQPVRPKQVSGLLGHIVKAQEQGNGLDIAPTVGSDYSSSGSEHEISSVCLAEMVHEFMEDEAEVGKCGRARCNCESGTCGDSSQSVDSDDKSSPGGELAEILQGFISSASFSERAVLASVTSTMQECKELAEVAGNEKAVRSLLMRHVMSSLRASGYNAAICKARWEHAGGLPGGDYEYIDVILGGAVGTTERIVVDIDFRTQFEIARPTPQYAAVLQTVPSVFVGKADRLHQIVNILCDAAKRSLKKKGMPLPPWRKIEYIRAKWFTSYRRTTKEAPASISRESSGVDIGRIALRGAGWDSKFTTEMETSFQKAADLRRVLRESNVMTSKALAASKKQEEVGPEGVVRGAHRMLAEVQLMERRNYSSHSSSNNDDIGVGGTNWEPPAVNLKPSAQKASRTVAGLALVLREAGMIAQSTQTLLEASQQQQQQCSAKGGALSRELALERA